MYFITQQEFNYRRTYFMVRIDSQKTMGVTEVYTRLSASGLLQISQCTSVTVTYSTPKYLGVINHFRELKDSVEKV